MVTPHKIAWTASDKASKGAVTINIYVSTDSGATYVPVALGLPNTGTYEWTPTNALATNIGNPQRYTALIKIVATDADGKHGEDTSDSGFSINSVAPTVTLIDPHNGQTYITNVARKVSWTATAGPGKGALTIDLYVSKDFGVTYIAVALGLPNTGTYAWVPPDSVATNTHDPQVFSAVMKIIARDAEGKTGEDLSDGYFSIYNAGTPTLLSLFHAAVVTGGVELRWRFVDPTLVSDVSVERGEASTGPWTVVNSELKTDGGETVALDGNTEAGKTYYYRLKGALPGGAIENFGLITAHTGESVTAFALTKVGPIPAKGTLNIEYTVAREALARISVVDVQGRLVAVVVDAVQKPGRYEAQWNARTDVPAGIYFVRYTVAGQSFSRRVVVTQ